METVAVWFAVGILAVLATDGVWRRRYSELEWSFACLLLGGIAAASMFHTTGSHL